MLQTSNTQNEVYSKNYLSFKIHAICPSRGMPKPFCLFLICILNSYPLKTITCLQYNFKKAATPQLSEGFPLCSNSQ